MNIQEYISSGIVESYVLGLVTDQERTEFERLCAAHTEVRAARESFEVSLEQVSMAGAVQPPRQLRTKIMSELKIDTERTGTLRAIPSTDSSATVRDEVPVVRMNKGLRYLAAASVVLLIGSIAMNIYFFNQYKSSDSKYQSLLAVNTELAQNQKALQTSNSEYESTLQMLKDPAMAIIKMAGNAVPTSPDPSSMATVYWDTRSKDVFILVNKMPAPATDKQYQLWAIVDGVPVDAGVFDIAGKPVIKMKNIQRAQAFAVTLEKRGGSATPSKDMYVLGKVS
ncbi:MAG: anti-sigma factor [Chitinophagaceae bacterium]|nr:anti-sigma factor [Chitinophagaceae bacterium]